MKSLRLPVILSSLCLVGCTNHYSSPSYTASEHEKCNYVDAKSRENSAIYLAIGVAIAGIGVGFGLMAGLSELGTGFRVIGEELRSFLDAFTVAVDAFFKAQEVQKQEGQAKEKPLESSQDIAVTGQSKSSE